MTGNAQFQDLLPGGQVPQGRLDSRSHQDGLEVHPT
jgi:hypothetical protein